MIVKSYAKPAATKASITLANDSGDGLALSRNAAAILYTRNNNRKRIEFNYIIFTSLLGSYCGIEFTIKNIEHAEQHELNKRETMKEDAEERKLHTNTEAEVILEIVPNKVGKGLTKYEKSFSGFFLYPNVFTSRNDQ